MFLLRINNERLKKNSEVRIQESAILTLVPLYETLRERYRYAISRGFRPATFLLTTKFSCFVGVQKRRLFRRFFGQKTLLNSDS
ncbi:MAG: hypothetical protein V7K90_28970 [Nostoc sp.]|uniref:hypothetical protein n=1 Tax=Nostoc sp. TaxID=1180 RepID=UPI002FF6D102